MAASAGALRNRMQCILQTGVGRVAAIGQPIPLSHPELLRPGELQPGVAAAEFATRRDRLAGLLPDGAVAVLPAAPVVYMAGEPSVQATHQSSELPCCLPGSCMGATQSSIACIMPAAS